MEQVTSYSEENVSWDRRIKKRTKRLKKTKHYCRCSSSSLLTISKRCEALKFPPKMKYPYYNSCNPSRDNPFPTRYFRGRRLANFIRHKYEKIDYDDKYATAKPFFVRIKEKNHRKLSGWAPEVYFPFKSSSLRKSLWSSDATLPNIENKEKKLTQANLGCMKENNSKAPTADFKAESERESASLINSAQLFESISERNSIGPIKSRVVREVCVSSLEAVLIDDHILLRNNMEESTLLKRNKHLNNSPLVSTKVNGIENTYSRAMTIHKEKKSTHKVYSFPISKRNSIHKLKSVDKQVTAFDNRRRSKSMSCLKGLSSFTIYHSNRTSPAYKLNEVEENRKSPGLNNKVKSPDSSFEKANKQGRFKNNMMILQKGETENFKLALAKVSKLPRRSTLEDVSGQAWTSLSSKCKKKKHQRHLVFAHKGNEQGERFQPNSESSGENVILEDSNGTAFYQTGHSSSGIIPPSSSQLVPPSLVKSAMNACIPRIKHPGAPP